MSIPAWLAKWRVTSDWAAHRARGSLGGIDWATPTGTPIYAPSDGIVDFRFYGDGSSVIRIRRADNTRTEFLHGTFLGGNFRPVKAGERVGTSDGRRGTRGAGSSTGPHVHVHDVTAAGVRVPPFSTIRNAPITDTGQGLPNMKQYSIFLHREGKNQAWQLVGDGVRSLISESAKRELLPVVEGGSGVVGRAGSEALDAHLIAVQAQRGGGSYVGPDAEQIATEVIRQQKLPGN